MRLHNRASACSTGSYSGCKGKKQGIGRSHEEAQALLALDAAYLQLILPFYFSLLRGAQSL